MPPKLKKKGKGKGGDEIEDKFKKATHEISSLKDELVFRKELVRRAQSVTNLSRNKTLDLELEIDDLRIDAKSNNAELVRQYRAVEIEMNNKIASLQVELERTKQDLAQVRLDYSNKCEELKNVTYEKDKRISQLEDHIQNMERYNLNILNAAFDTLAGKVKDAKDRWVSEAVDIKDQHKRKLLDELGLKPLEI